MLLCLRNILEFCKPMYVKMTANMAGQIQCKISDDRVFLDVLYYTVNVVYKIINKLDPY